MSGVPANFTTCEHAACKRTIGVQKDLQVQGNRPSQWRLSGHRMPNGQRCPQSRSLVESTKVIQRGVRAPRP